MVIVDQKDYIDSILKIASGTDYFKTLEDDPNLKLFKDYYDKTKEYTMRIMKDLFLGFSTYQNS